MEYVRSDIPSFMSAANPAILVGSNQNTNMNRGGFGFGSQSMFSVQLQRPLHLVFKLASM